MTVPSVLLVDDEHRFRQVLFKRLSHRGLNMFEAENGSQAIECMEESPSDIVVLDVKMPGMNGIETLQILRKRFPSSEVILLTGHASTEDGIAGIKAGAFDYLTKPVEIEHLEGKIQQAYDKILRIREQVREREFRCLLEQRMIAAQRLASLGTLATGIAHEVNNPLAVINDASGWLLDLLKTAPADMPLRKELELGLGKIGSNVARARRITHQLLSHARQSEPEITEIDLGHLAKETSELVNKEALAHNVNITIHTCGTPLTVRSDSGQLRQVLINLLTNAIHAAESGGQVKIELSALEHHVRLQVMDDGAGIPEELLKRIFDPFFSTKPEGRGTGLGLFVTNNIIRRLGGTIEATNCPQRGAVFTVTIARDFTPPAANEEVRQ
ncbi:MAG: response regulator [Proteobacteria bacterium]|nr:response regulator [Pseudomonadota bacterium]